MRARLEFTVGDSATATGIDYEALVLKNGIVVACVPLDLSDPCQTYVCPECGSEVDTREAEAV